MRIDNDCVRDILLTIEEHSTFETPCYIMGYKKKYPLLEKYDSDKFSYHLRYAKMKGLIFTPDGKRDENVDLTPDGHDYLNSIRENNGI